MDALLSCAPFLAPPAVESRSTLFNVAEPMSTDESTIDAALNVDAGPSTIVESMAFDPDCPNQSPRGDDPPASASDTPGVPPLVRGKGECCATSNAPA